MYKAQGALKYIVEVSTDAQFSRVVAVDSSVTDTFKVISTLQPTTKHFWRVISVAGTVVSTSSAVWNFTTVAAPPQAPELISPQNNSTGIPTATLFMWKSNPPQ